MNSISRRTRRQEEAQRRARRQRQQRLIGVAVVALIAIGLIGGGWRLTRGSGPSQAQALARFSTEDFHSLAFDPTDPDTIYFGHHQGLKVTHDGGKSWQDTAVKNADAMELGFPSGDPSRRYVAGHNVFQISLDGGKTWGVPSTNLPDGDLHGFAVAPSDPFQLYTYAVGVDRLFSSADGGTNWEGRTLPPGASGMLPLVVAPDDPLHLFAGASTQLAESRDGGKTWQQQPGPGGMIVSLTITPSASATFYAGTDQGLWKRTGSDPWQQVAVKTDGAVLALAASPSQPERIALVDEHGNFYRTDDGGQTWAER